MDQQWQDLSRPFKESEIEWRFQRAGISNGKPWAMVLAYISFPSVVKRLNEVVGPENWQCKFQVESNGAYTCQIGIKVGDEWVWKSNGSDETRVEAVKGGYSTAFKRNAAMWGIGLYLYALGDCWAMFDEKGRFRDKITDKYYRWNPPPLPGWALPGKNGNQNHQSDQVPEEPGEVLAEDKVKQTSQNTEPEQTDWDARGWFSERFKNLRSASSMMKEVKRAIKDGSLELAFKKHTEGRDLLQQKWQTLKDAGKIDVDFGVFLIDQGFTPPRAETGKEHVPVTPEDVEEVFGHPTVPQPLAKDIQIEMDTIRAGMKGDGKFVNWETFDKFLSQTAKQQELTKEGLIAKMVKTAKHKEGKAIMMKAMIDKYLAYLEFIDE